MNAGAGGGGGGGGGGGAERFSVPLQRPAGRSPIEGAGEGEGEEEFVHGPTPGARSHGTLSCLDSGDGRAQTVAPLCRFTNASTSA